MNYHLSTPFPMVKTKIHIKSHYCINTLVKLNNGDTNRVSMNCKMYTKYSNMAISYFVFQSTMDKKNHSCSKSQDQGPSRQTPVSKKKKKSVIQPPNYTVLLNSETFHLNSSEIQ